MINNIHDITVLHLEPTTKCNAACPQCQRTINLSNLAQSDITVEHVKRFFPESFILQLKKMFMCGNFGDPAAGEDTINIFKYFKEVNPSITLGMNTNGGINSSHWWNELATVFSGPHDSVIFSIDGLEDTNHIYRINVRWQKLINNITAFIANGGNAQWDMLLFKHNEHQVNEAMSLAKSLGMTWFRSKITRRDLNVVNLQLPSTNAIRLKPQLPINCHVVAEKSIYIDASGLLFPCCFIGNKKMQPNFFKSYNVSEDLINLHKTSLEEAYQQFNHIPLLWDNNPMPECLSYCGTTLTSSPFLDQWKNSIQLR